MNPKTIILSPLFIFTLLLPYFSPTHATENPKQPDIVFLIVDDLNDYLGCLGGHPNAKSPNIDKLAASGMLFTQAYCNSPQCRPSRTSLNHGIYPFKTGTYFNARYNKETSIKTHSMQQFFMNNGYRVASGGKVHHGGPGRHGHSLKKRPGDPKPDWNRKNFNVNTAPPSDGHPLNVKDEQMGDYKVATWAIDEWQKPTDKPLFMSVGFYRPHRPLQVPKPYFDQFPLDTIKRPAEPDEDDWNDLSPFAQMLARSHAHKPMHNGLSDHEYIVANKQWDTTLQAYLASIAFVDQQIGRFLNALKTNPRNRETFIMLVSDHGWHLGEKKHWCKGAIWEQTTRIPFIVTGPGIKPGSKNKTPVSLIDVYPTLIDLAGLKIPNHLDGLAITPLLKGKTHQHPPVISSYGEANTAIRTERYRYIRYEDGSEELYDHHLDPNEWNNLANNPQYTRIKKDLTQHIPKNQHPGLKVKESWFDRFQKDFKSPTPSKQNATRTP